ncbi:MAG: hypothetical protein H7Y42_12765 [Chitinophagaceae bacterium]|nr:hypothetical protein [Chitinophagaceae bacterium]
MRLWSSFLPIFVLITLLISCDKDEKAPSPFNGKWKASYNDTIEFSRISGRDVLIWDVSMNPTLPGTTQNEYTYQFGKLAIKDGLWGPGFRTLQTFSWIQEGQSFTVQGVEWFAFMSSTSTWFTFTRIP